MTQPYVVFSSVEFLMELYDILSARLYLTLLLLRQSFFPDSNLTQNVLTSDYKIQVGICSVAGVWGVRLL